VSNLPQHGFGTINNWKSSATTNLQAAAVLSAASGVSFKLSAGTRLYTGLYVDYGLTDLKSKNGDMPLVTYSPSGISGVQANSVLNMSIAGQVTSLSYGLQLRLSFGSTETKPAARAKTKTTQGPQQIAKTAISEEEIAVIQKPIVFGGIGEISVPENQKPHLNELANIMLKYPTIRITIVGHTCICGAETENIKVGQGRASAVASYLRLKGIDASRMDVSAVSETNPVLSYDPAANFQNRRVVITLK
jgi:outer membrane protein OmpA-like peptidoglycan-associated protein